MIRKATPSKRRRLLLRYPRTHHRAQRVSIRNSASLLAPNSSPHAHPRTDRDRNPTTSRNSVRPLTNHPFRSLLPSKDFGLQTNDELLLLRNTIISCDVTGVRNCVGNPPMRVVAVGTSGSSRSSDRCGNELRERISPTASSSFSLSSLFSPLSLVTTTWSVLILLALNASGGVGLLLRHGTSGHRIGSYGSRSRSSNARTFGRGTAIPVWSGLVRAIPTMSGYSALFAEAFHPAASRSTTNEKNDENDDDVNDDDNGENENENDNESTCEADQSRDEGHNDGGDDPLPEGTPHPEDDRLWLYHYESTNSTQDQAKRIAEHLSSLPSSSSSSSLQLPTSFCVTASMQTKGRGTSGREWMGAPGNVFVTMGVPTRTWMTTLLRDRKIPLTLLPLTIGTMVAELVQSELDRCGGSDTDANTDTDSVTAAANANANANANAAVVTAKWPNDVLVDGKKISGTLIESSPNGDWFLIGIGINVAHAPTVPTTGTDYGRASVSLREYGCGSNENDDDDDDRESSLARALGVKLALGFHRWMRANTESDSGNDSGYNRAQRATAESIVEGWKRWLDKDAEWTVRNDGGPGRRPRVVRLLDVLPDGRIKVRNKETGAEEILVSDYFV